MSQFLMKEDTSASSTLTPLRKVTPPSLSWVSNAPGLVLGNEGMALTARWLPAARKRLTVNFTVLGRLTAHLAEF